MKRFEWNTGFWIAVAPRTCRAPTVVFPFFKNRYLSFFRRIIFLRADFFEISLIFYNLAKIILFYIGSKSYEEKSLFDA